MLCESVRIAESCLQEALAEETERRNTRRKPFFRRAEITLASEPTAAAAAYSRDISRQGIGLLHAVPLESGDEFTLSIPLIGRNLSLQCRTDWCEPLVDGWYCSGNDYRCSSAPQTLFLLSAVLVDELHRRLQRRYPYFRPVTLENEEGHKCEAFCRDVSQGGIGLIHRESIALGTTLVSMTSERGENVIAGVDIRRCVPIGNGWYSSGGHFPAEDL
jgi:hypothetical protein